MHMPEKRRGERHYLLWDPLQLREGISGPYVVTRAAVNFDFFRVFRGKVNWRSMQRESVLFLHEGQDFTYNLLAQSCRQARLRDLGESLDIDFYDFNQGSGESCAPMAQKILSLDDENSFFRYHPFNDDLEKFVDSLISHRRNIREAMAASNIIDAPGKKIQIVAVFLGENQVEELKNNATLQLKLESLASKSAAERLHLWVFCNNYKNFPPKVMIPFDMQIFLGEDAQTLCQTILHSDIEPNGESVYQDRIGIMFDKMQGELTPLHRLKYTPSQWLLARDGQRQSADEQYRKILEELYDGS